jgi:hypothetical protein
MHTIAVIVKLLMSAILCAGLLLAQSKEATQDEAARSKAQAAPPALADVSGTYSFLRDGEVLEFHLQEGKVIGDVQRLGSSDADRGVMLTHFFDKAAIDANRLEFTTNTVHGVHYRFEGEFKRGEGKTRAEEDYYRIVGTLTEYLSDARKKISARKREVIFKSLPDELGESSEKSK